MSVWSPYLRGFRSQGTSAPHLERVLAVGRAFLTVSGLIAIYLDPTEPTRLAGIVYGVLLGYAVYSVAVLVWAHRTRGIGPDQALALHGMDVLWTSALTFVSEGPFSPFFLFFLFVVLASAYRWGFRGTMATTVVTVVVFLLETGIAAAGPWDRLGLGGLGFDLNRTVLRVAYLLLTGVLLAYLAEEEKESRAEIVAIAEAARQPRIDAGLGGSVAAVCEGLVHTFAARGAAMVLEDTDNGRTLLWRIGGDAPSAVSLRMELNPPDRSQWLFPAPGRAWHATPSDVDGEWSCRATEPRAWPLRREKLSLPASVAGAAGRAAITGVDIGLPGEWTGRIYLFGISPPVSLDRGLHFLESLADHIAPALTNVFLMRRLRSQASAAERARVARELHDGSIQALLGIEMKIEALRRSARAREAEPEQGLAEIQELVRREVLALRELMQALRPIELDSSEQLPDVLASIVERFRRDTGVTARFLATGGPVSLHPVTALEIVRIVQEALVNVRKHSRARNVLVRLTRIDQECQLAIEDDGTGFEFDGRLSADDLERRRLGPAIIRERARIAGARLAIESRRGRGARIEISVPETTHA